MMSSSRSSRHEPAGPTPNSRCRGPVKSNLPMLPKPSFGRFASREEALAHCKKLIESLVT